MSTTGTDNKEDDNFERAAEQIEAPLTSLVGDYEESHDSGAAAPARGVFLLPNLFTTGALFCGFYSVIAGMQGDFYAGSVAILVAMIFDGLDGRVARLTHTTSAFGAEYDSLSDMISFGIAPALLMFNWALVDTGKLGWVAAFLYTACAALRLARFNTQRDSVDAGYFVGLPSPAAAAAVTGSVWLGQTHELPASMLPLAWLHAVLLAGLGFLMIARFPYFSFKSIKLDGRVPFVRIFLMVGVLALIALDPPLFIWVFSFLYAVSGPIQHLRQNVVQMSQKENEDRASQDS
ncbi:MAG: CDP-diacylglycerol--serine O-phosphatidyltransferase [Luminiphilus sp.]|jgi:CDP-diacylglycerol--serine O-phosphatidyltransferase|nr:CDP-diacylglycerol--serine O-phosphatidyltransferase [Luminiphilus sp.]MDG1461468.1 CDP-diacylglycerol--serine O-phosphatidyltransferase [Luminiphilus sp.]